MDEELDRLMFEYNNRFNEGFPSFQLFRTRSDKECVEIIKRCLDEGKTAYEIGLVTDDQDLEY